MDSKETKHEGKRPGPPKTEIISIGDGIYDIAGGFHSYSYARQGELLHYLLDNC